MEVVRNKKKQQPSSRSSRTDQDVEHLAREEGELEHLHKEGEPENLCQEGDPMHLRQEDEIKHVRKEEEKNRLIVLNKDRRMRCQCECFEFLHWLEYAAAVVVDLERLALYRLF